MKKLLTLTLLLALTISSYAQEYIFEVNEGDYIDLIGDTLLIKDSIRETDVYYLHLNYRPKFNGDTTPPINGGEFFSLPGTHYTNLLYSNNKGFVDLEPFYLGIKTGTGTTPIKFKKNPKDSLSNISFVIEGSVGTRIFKAQYRNMLYEDANEGDLINFQVWWHEATGVIEYHYGKMIITNFEKAFGHNYKGPVVIFNADPNDSDEKASFWNSIYGNPSSPRIESRINEWEHMDTVPNEGLIYRFVPTFFTGIDDNNPFKGFTLYPNPSTNGTIYLDQLPKEVNTTVSVIDMTGKMVKQINLNSNEIKQSIKIENPGIYVIKLASEIGYTASRKVLVK